MKPNISNISERDELPEPFKSLGYKISKPKYGWGGSNITKWDGTKATIITPEHAEEILKAIKQLLLEVGEEVQNELLYDLDEIDNKPWRVFRQLAAIMPYYAEDYLLYAEFYAYGGGNKIKQLLEDFKKSDDYKRKDFEHYVTNVKKRAAEQHQRLHSLYGGEK